MAAHGSRMALFAPLLVRFPVAKLRNFRYLRNTLWLTISTLTFSARVFHILHWDYRRLPNKGQNAAKLLYIGGFRNFRGVLTNVVGKLVHEHVTSYMLK